MKRKNHDESIRQGSILDLFLFFLILFLILGIVFRWKTLRDMQQNSELVSCYAIATMEGVDPHVGTCMKEGERIYTASGEPWGWIRTIETRPSPISLIANGQQINGIWDETVKCDLFLQLEFLGSEDDETVLWNATHTISVGQVMNLYSERCALHLTIISFESAFP